MSTEVEKRAGDVAGTVEDRGLHHAGQESRYSALQRDQLRALMNCAEASDADLDMLAMVAERSGLDPFLREMHMIGRKTKTGGYRGEPERWETRWTVQVGIDGLRKVTHRVAEQRGVSTTIDTPIFYSQDGKQTRFWSKAWGVPVAAESTVRLGESTGTHVVMWEEYAQTRVDKSGREVPTGMWLAKPALMLGKCAEAGAHRKVTSLSAGLYIAEEIDAPIMRGEAAHAQSESPSGSRTGDVMAAIESMKPDPETELVRGILDSISNASSIEELDYVLEQVGDVKDESNLALLRGEYQAKKKALKK